MFIWMHHACRHIYMFCDDELMWPCDNCSWHLHNTKWQSIFCCLRIGKYLIGIWKSKWKVGLTTYSSVLCSYNHIRFFGFMRFDVLNLCAAEWTLECVSSSVCFLCYQCIWIIEIAITNSIFAYRSMEISTSNILPVQIFRYVSL